MSTKYLFFLIVLSCSPIARANGIIEVAKSYKIKSEILEESRDYYISLPKSYEKTSHQYPVLVLLDADQNMQHAVSSAQNLAQWRGIPEIIVVGIPSINRPRDFTPSKDISFSAESGHGEKFMQFIKQELLPIIDKQFRTHPYRILEGHSLGGLFVATELMSMSNFFNAFIIAAPSLWWKNFEAIEQAKTLQTRENQAETAVYLGIGEHDGDGMKAELSQFVSSLQQAPHLNLRIEHKEFVGEGHMSAPLLINYYGLLHIFSDVQYPKEKWDDFTIKAFVSFEQALKQKYGPGVIQTAENYVGLARHLENSNNFAGAIAVLKSNSLAYSGYHLNHELLANAYALNDDLQQAIEQYEIAYELTRSSKQVVGDSERYLQRIERLKNPIDIPKSAMEAMSGCYENEGRYLAFRAIEGKFTGSNKVLGTFELFPTEKRQFVMFKQPQYQYHFSIKDKHKKVILNTGGSTLEFKFVGEFSSCNSHQR